MALGSAHDGHLKLLPLSPATPSSPSLCPQLTQRPRNVQLLAYLIRAYKFPQYLDTVPANTQSPMTNDAC